MRNIIIMKKEDNNAPEKENSEKNSREMIFLEDILGQMPAVALMVLLPEARENKPRPLVYANRSLLRQTGYDPEALKNEECDFFARVLHPDDLCLMTKALDHLLQNPHEKYKGVVFRIKAAWDECLYVICNCKVVTFKDGSPSLAICDWQVYDEKNIPREGLRNWLKILDRKDYEKKLSELTCREIEVLTLLGKGLNYAAVGDKLFIGYKTVECHICNIKNKLNLHSLNELIAFAISAGLC
jgi:DNA-binding CsgD family transcriptional regulator